MNKMLKFHSQYKLVILKKFNYIINDNYLYNLSEPYKELIIDYLYSYYQYNLNLFKIIKNINYNKKYIDKKYLIKYTIHCEKIIKKNKNYVQNFSYKN